MSKRLRIRLLLVIAACVVGAGVASATIQRSASNADFAEYSGVTNLRVEMLAQDAALQEALDDPSSRSLERFTAARHTFQVSMAKALARDEEADELASLEQQERIAEQWTQRAERGVAVLLEGRRGRDAGATDPERTRLLQAFLKTNREMLTDLAEEREERQQHALELRCCSSGS